MFNIWIYVNLNIFKWNKILFSLDTFSKIKSSCVYLDLFVVLFYHWALAFVRGDMNVVSKRKSNTKNSEHFREKNMIEANTCVNIILSQKLIFISHLRKYPYLPKSLFLVLKTVQLNECDILQMHWDLNHLQNEHWRSSNFISYEWNKAAVHRG